MIAASALQLCNAATAHEVTLDGALMHSAALATDRPVVIEAARALFPRPPDCATAASRATLALHRRHA